MPHFRAESVGLSTLGRGWSCIIGRGARGLIFTPADGPTRFYRSCICVDSIAAALLNTTQQSIALRQGHKAFKMAPSFLPSINIATYTQPTSGLNPKELSYVGDVFTTLEPASVDDAFLYLQQTFGLFSTSFDVTALTSLDDILSLLDSGAAKVFVSREQLEQLRSAKNVDLDRVVLSISGRMDGTKKNEIIDAISGTSVGVYAAGVEDVELVEAWLKEYATPRPEVYVSFTKPIAENVLRVAKLSAIPIIPAEQLTVEGATAGDSVNIAQLLLVNATSDRPDGLFTTLVTDERGIALGLVYSSAESVAESLKTGRGVYQSRKRGLWYKGESSGDIQELVKVSLDCDSDCLQFTVKQKGRGKGNHCRGDAPERMLTFYRLLPPRNRDLLRTLQRSCSPSTDPTKSQSFCPRRLLHGSSIQRSQSPQSEDHGGSSRTLRSYYEGECRLRSRGCHVLRSDKVHCGRRDIGGR